MRTACEPDELGLHHPSLPASAPTWWSSLETSFRKAYDSVVPLGYQDEWGFHLGPEPEPDLQEPTSR